MSLTELRYEAVLEAVRSLEGRYVSTQEVATQMRLNGTWDLFETTMNRRGRLMAVLRRIHLDGKLDRTYRASGGTPEPVYRIALNPATNPADT